MKDYSMTDNSFGARLETFKQRIDNAANTALNSIEYKQRGGLNFLKVGKLSVQWSVSKPKRATKPVAYKPEPQVPVVSQDNETTIPNWQSRMLIGTRQG